jgi:hypothetical protein
LTWVTGWSVVRRIVRMPSLQCTSSSVGHVDRHGLVRVDSAQGELLAGDGDDAGVAGAPFQPDRSGRG